VADVIGAEVDVDVAFICALDTTDPDRCTLMATQMNVLAALTSGACGYRCCREMAAAVRIMYTRYYSQAASGSKKIKR
jgi:hypothetical protein